MKSLCILLFTSIVAGSVSPSKREADPGIYAALQSDQCHGKTYQKCFTIPKHEEFDDCVDIVDTIYIDECEHVIHTHCEEEFTHVHVFDSHIITQDSHVPKCDDKEYKECHRVKKEIIRTECKAVLKTIYVKQCEDD